MKRGIFPKSFMWYLATASVLAACLIPASPSPAAALSVNPYDYFDINYSISFSDSEVQEGETFYLVVEGQATCIKDLPVGADQIAVTGNIIAQHEETGATEMLNAGYSVTISPVPDWKGESYEFHQRVRLSFPGGSQSGQYNVIGELVQAEIVESGDAWDVTDIIPERYRTRTIGTVNYVETTEEVTPPQPQQPVPTPPAEPLFVVTNMSISPTQVQPEQAVTISVEVRNDGNAEGSYILNLTINGELQDSREIVLAPGETRTLTYKVSRSEAGNYNVTLDGQSGTFTVVPVSPPAFSLHSWLSQHWWQVAVVIINLVLFSLLWFMYRHRTVLKE